MNLGSLIIPCPNTNDCTRAKVTCCCEIQNATVVDFAIRKRYIGRAHKIEIPYYCEDILKENITCSIQMNDWIIGLTNTEKSIYFNLSQLHLYEPRLITLLMKDLMHEQRWNTDNTETSE